MSAEVEPELELILNRIGWREARLLHPSLFVFTWVPSRTHPLLAKSRPQHDELADNFARVLRSLVTLADGLATLPPALAERIEHTARLGEEWDGEDARRPRLEEWSGALGEMAAVLAEVQAQIAFEGERYWKNRSPDQHAHMIAWQLAQIYVVGRGALPRVGSAAHNERQDASGNRPTTLPAGLYPSAVQDVFDLFGIRRSFKGYCDEAVKRLREGEEAEFRRLLAIRERGLGRVSHRLRRRTRPG